MCNAIVSSLCVEILLPYIILLSYVRATFCIFLKLWLDEARVASHHAVPDSNMPENSRIEHVTDVSTLKLLNTSSKFIVTQLSGLPDNYLNYQLYYYSIIWFTLVHVIINNH